MASKNVHVEQVSPLENHHRHPSEQPIDRHHMEITDENGSVFMNAGIDSTCGKKRTDIIHTLPNDTVTSSETADPASVPMIKQLDSLILSHSADLENGGGQLTSVCGSDARLPDNCSQCGK